MFTRAAPAFECLFMTICIEYKYCAYDWWKFDVSKILLKCDSVLRFCWSVGLSLSTLLLICLTNQILYRIILFSTAECFWIQTGKSLLGQNPAGEKSGWYFLAQAIVSLRDTVTLCVPGYCSLLESCLNSSVYDRCQNKQYLEATIHYGDKFSLLLRHFVGAVTFQDKTKRTTYVQCVTFLVHFFSLNL